MAHVAHREAERFDPTKILAQQLADRNIRVNASLPDRSGPRSMPPITA
jgi:hypothetical protein